MMKWIRFRGKGAGYSYWIASNKFIVQLTGGSIIIKDRHSNEIFKRYHDLHTGDISPDETECFALVKRVTLPKSYDSVDMFGHYSEDGEFIYIPAHRWVRNPHNSEGYYEYVVFRYETENYTPVDKGESTSSLLLITFKNRQSSTEDWRFLAVLYEMYSYLVSRGRWIRFTFSFALDERK